MTTLSQKTETLDNLLSRTLARQGFDCTSVKGRIEAGRRYGVSHQTIANYLAGHLPPAPRIPLLAAAMGVGERRLRQMIERQRHPGNRADDADASTVAHGDRT